MMITVQTLVGMNNLTLSCTDSPGEASEALLQRRLGASRLPRKELRLFLTDDLSGEKTEANRFHCQQESCKVNANFKMNCFGVSEAEGRGKGVYSPIQA